MVVSGSEEIWIVIAPDARAQAPLSALVRETRLVESLVCSHRRRIEVLWLPCKTRQTRVIEVEVRYLLVVSQKSQKWNVAAANVGILSDTLAPPGLQVYVLIEQHPTSTYGLPPRLLSDASTTSTCVDRFH